MASLPEVCVVYLLRHAEGRPEVLIGQKLHGLGSGKFVAPGGKLESGESPRQAAVREVREEVGLSVAEDALELVGELTYVFPARPSWNQRSWAFRVFGEWGAPSVSDELDARWIPLDEAPFELMWDDAKYWLVDALAGSRVVALFEFGADLSTVVSSNHPGFAERF